MATVARAHSGLRVEEFGDASSSKQFDDKLAQDFQKAEFLSIPITLLILILAFGALLAAGIPVLLGLTSVFTAFGLTAVSSQFMATGESTQILIMLIGMAVAVDYSLFYLKREREERARGRRQARRARGRRRDERPRRAGLRPDRDGLARRACSSWACRTAAPWRSARSSSSASRCSAR